MNNKTMKATVVFLITSIVVLLWVIGYNSLILYDLYQKSQSGAGQ